MIKIKKTIFYKDFINFIRLIITYFINFAINFIIIVQFLYIKINFV
jgi:hypothetical protein